MFSIACTITKKTVSSSPSSSSSSSPPVSPTLQQQIKPATVITSSMTTTTTRIQRGTTVLNENGQQPNFRRRSTFRKIFMSIGIIIAVGASLTDSHLTPYRAHHDFPPRSRTPCLDEVASRQRHAAWLDEEYGQSPAHRAHHLPQCLPNGLYNATQCRTELDLCWCVGERTGRVLTKVFHPGRAEEIRCSDAPEQEQQNSTDTAAGSMDAGNSTLSGNNTSMGNNTNASSSSAQSQQQPPQQQQKPRRRLRDGPCIWAKRELAARRREKYGDGRPLLGAFEPQCTDDGLFERTQCHASSGFCWCVDEHTGERISQAFRSWVRGIDCDAEEFLVNASFRA